MFQDKFHLFTWTDERVVEEVEDLKCEVCELKADISDVRAELSTIRKESERIKLMVELARDRKFDSAELTESPVSHRCRSPAATAELRRRLTGKLAGGDGGAAAADGGPAAELRWRRFPAAARAFHARAKGGFLEARTASSGLRLRRAWCLRLRLDERNTMMGLDARDSQRLRSYGRFTKTAETKLKNMAVSGYLWLRMMVVASSTVWRTVAPARTSAPLYRKSKRPRVVPRSLVGDYQCDKRILVRAWEAHVNATRRVPNIDYAVKFTELYSKLESPFTIKLDGLSLTSKELSAIVDRSTHLPSKVLDVLIHHTRSVFQSHPVSLQSKNS
ncbi:hypothetical protein F2Q69_00028807, partial [Brassica cretica]